MWCCVLGACSLRRSRLASISFSGPLRPCIASTCGWKRSTFPRRTSSPATTSPRKSTRFAISAWSTPNLAMSQVQNYQYATSQLAQTTLRSIVGQFELDEILSQRDEVNAKLQVILDQDTEPWGIKVGKVEVKQVDIPRAHAACHRQAGRSRTRAPRRRSFTPRANSKPAEKLADAAKVLQTEASAIQLRYLQTLTEIGVEKNTTIVFPLPIDIINKWTQALGGSNK